MGRGHRGTVAIKHSQRPVVNGDNISILADTTSGMMNGRKLKKLRIEIEAATASPYNVKRQDLIRWAGKLGREERNRGKEPTYVRDDDPTLSPPLTIPASGKTTSIGVTRSVLDFLINDIDTWELFLLEIQKKG